MSNSSRHSSRGSRRHVRESGAARRAPLAIAPRTTCAVGATHSTAAASRALVALVVLAAAAVAAVAVAAVAVVASAKALLVASKKRQRSVGSSAAVAAAEPGKVRPWAVESAIATSSDAEIAHSRSSTCFLFLVS